MAKLSPRQKVNIKAKFDTGEYTKTELAKLYKVTDKVIRDIVGKEEPANSHIVEAAVIVEKAKKYGKSTAESTAINQAVKERLEREHYDDKNTLRIYELTDKVLDKVEGLLNNGTKKVRMGMGAGIQVLEETDLDSTDYKNVIETIDKASVIKRVSDRHAPKGDINVNATSATQNNYNVLSDEELQEEMKKRGIPSHLKTLIS